MPAGRAKKSTPKLAADLPAITGDELSSISEAPDSQTSDELHNAEWERIKCDIADSQQNREERKKYAGRIFWLICGWVASLLIILLFQGFGSYKHFHFYLTQPVMLATIGSTTVDILGMFYIVTHYLFPSSPSETRTPKASRKKVVAKL